LILDRGLFDSLWWLALLEHLTRIRTAERRAIERFLMIEDWRTRITGVVVMTTDPKDALHREQGHLPVVGVHGSIMNPAVLQKAREFVDDTINRLTDKFNIFRIDTSSRQYRNKAKETCYAVASVLLDWIEQQLREDILAMPKAHVVDIFRGAPCLNAQNTRSLIDSFTAHGEFRPRQDVESDLSCVQALPVVVVRNQSGHVLRLRRKERRKENPLNEELVIWAGGHVRKEDAFDGDSLIRCAIRELQEELRLSVTSDTLTLLGSVYADHGGSTSKHVAIVYEWRAASDDLSIALSSAEFFERRGTSLSGSFVSLDVLTDEVDTEKMAEAWTAEIVKTLLAPDHDYTRRLL
jgi:predicted NUDIX family phosphoesterase